MKNNTKCFWRISSFLHSSSTEFSSLEELLSFGEISFDTVEPLADRFLITYGRRWVTKKRNRKKNGVFSFVLYKEIHQRDGDENLFILFWPLSRKKNDRRSLPVDEASRRLLAVSWQANLTGWQSVVEVNSTRHFSTEEPLLNIKIKEHSTLMVSP